MPFNWTLNYAVKPAFCDLAEKCVFLCVHACDVTVDVFVTRPDLGLVSVDHSKEDS